ncbi:MAG: hypothetical protein WAN23_07915 [Candidatus Acidiferrales bacterium]
MNHHRGVNAVETAALEQEDFSPGVAHFFGGRADYGDGEADIIGHFGGGQRGANGRSGNYIVAAGVADSGKGIVFGTNADVQWPRPGAGAERRGQIANAFFHREAGVGQRFAQPGRGLLFLEAKLGVRVDAVAEIDQAVASGFETLAGSGFGVHRCFPCRLGFRGEDSTAVAGREEYACRHGYR